MFQGAEVPVLMFPTLQIAQARVWRNWEGPASQELKSAIDAASFGGLDREQVGFLIGLCEALIRPLRAVELALEKLFPHFLFSRSTTWPPSAVVCDLLAHDFRQRWKEEEKVYRREWVLAAGKVPLRLKHRPALIAPWVVGATLKRWLALKGATGEQAIKQASGLTAVLFGREVRAEEFRHWTDLVENILVATEGGNVTLPGYLIKAISRENTTSWPEQMTPAFFLEAFPIDVAACEQLAHLLKRAWLNHDQKKKTARTMRRMKLDNHRVFSCCLCERKQITTDTIWPHLRDVHHIAEADIEIPDRSYEIRQDGTGTIVATWRDSE